MMRQRRNIGDLLPGTLFAPGSSQQRVGDGFVADYRLVRRKRRKSIRIEVERDGEVLVIAPLWVPRSELDGVVLEKASWIAKRRAELAEAPPPPTFADGSQMLYLGQPMRLRLHKGQPSRSYLSQEPPQPPPSLLAPSFLEAAEVPAEPAGSTQDRSASCAMLHLFSLHTADASAVKRSLVRWYREQAQTLFEERVVCYAPLMGKEPTRVFARDQKRRWGSCNQKGELRLNWRLIQAPLAAIDGVIVHELAHLHHMNHGPCFWKKVENHLPDYRERDRLLKEWSPRVFW